MAEVLATPQERQEAARLKLKQHDDAVRANGIKQGRLLERGEMLQALGVHTLEDASQLAQIRQERDSRPTLGQYHRHGIARLFQGVAAGAAAAAILMSGLFLLVWREAVTVASREARETAQAGVMMGVASQAQTNETPVTDYERNRREPPSTSE